MKNWPDHSFKFILIFLILYKSSVGKWEPPLGIPNPEFGIEEIHYMYTNQTYSYNGLIGAYKDAGNGPYTHYVDNTNPKATDLNNPYGNKQKPRKSIPLNLQKGSVVELHGGPYSEPTFNGSSEIGVTGFGTKEKPIFVRGYSPENKIVFKKQITIRGKFIILENIIMNETILPEQGYIRIWSPSECISIRNNEATNFNGNTSVYAVQPKDSAAGGHPDKCFNENIVFFKNNIHQNGYPANEETGIQSIAVQGNSKKVWILDNIITYGGEDGIHIIFQKNKNAHHMADGIYIGRNLIHHHTENAIDVKHSKNVIISQNKMYGYKTVHFSNGSGSDGSALVLNDEGAGVPEKHYIIFNEIYDSDIGIRSEYSGYIYGNIFHNLDSAALVVLNGTSYIVNNTFYTNSKGISNNGGGATLYIYNNIISNVILFHIRYNTGAKREIANNLFYQPNGDAIIGHGGKMYKGLNILQSKTQAQQCFHSNPQFISVDSSDQYYLQLKPSSPAIKKGMQTGRVQEVINDFYSDFGLDINCDYNGVQRPSDSNWNIGAFESRHPN